MAPIRSLTILVLLASAQAGRAQTCGDSVPERGASLCVGAPVQALATNGEVRAVLAQDVNGDSRPDLVALTSTAVYVRFGSPGGLGATARRVHGGHLTDMAIGRFDGNDRPDLAIGDRAGARTLVSHDFGNGDLAVDTTHAGSSQSASWDCDGEHCYDCSQWPICDITVDPIVFWPDGRVYAPGSLATSYLVGDARHLALGDFDGVEGAELVSMAGQGPAAVLRVKRYDAAGLLLPAVQSAFSVEVDVESITTADLDGDLRADVAVATRDGRVVAGLSTGGGHITQRAAFAWGPPSTGRRLRTVDWDGDGNADLAAAWGSGPRYSVAWGDGDGTFGGANGIYAVEDLSLAAADPVRDLAFADLDGDGHLDVAVAIGDAVLVQRGNP